MIAAYESMFGEKPRPYSSLLERNDHLELDDSKILEAEDTTKYQSMVSALQWVIALRRFDVLTAVMMKARFRTCPHTGHLDRLKRMYGYLCKYKPSTIRICTKIPEMSEYPEVKL